MTCSKDFMKLKVDELKTYLRERYTIKPWQERKAERSARFAANPISDSRNQIIRISSWTILNFRFQKSAKRILSRRTKILKTENQ